MASTSPAGKKGFTLIEVMIAASLMSFEILAVLAMFNTSSRANSQARRITQASSLAQSRIEYAKNSPYANLSVAKPETRTENGLLAAYPDYGTHADVDEAVTAVSASPKITRLTSCFKQARVRVSNGPVEYRALMLPMACDNTEAVKRETTVYDEWPVAGMSRIRVDVTWTTAGGQPHKTTLISGISKF